MYRCNSCAAAFSGGEWTCPLCGFEPVRKDGFVCFAPDLSETNDGMNPQAHHVLNSAQDESFWFRVRNRVIADFIRRYFPHAMRVMEVGCGTGYVLAAIRQVLPDAQLFATEIYCNGLPYAANRVTSSCEFMQMDARAIPFTDEFDLIGAFDVIEHIDEDETVLDQMRQASKLGGGLIITVPQHRFLWSSVDASAHHKRRYSAVELSNKVKAAGFEIMRETSFSALLMPLMFLVRKLGDLKPRLNVAPELALPKPIDRTLEVVQELERKMLFAGINFPFGGSRLIAARRLR